MIYEYQTLNRLQHMISTYMSLLLDCSQIDRLIYCPPFNCSYWNGWKISLSIHCTTAKLYLQQQFLIYNIIYPTMPLSILYLYCFYPCCCCYCFTGKIRILPNAHYIQEFQARTINKCRVICLLPSFMLIAEFYADCRVLCYLVILRVHKK